MTTPYLYPVTPEQEAACHARLSHITFHRVEHKVCGWSWALEAFTLGQMWFWMQDGQEAATIVPVAGMPHTRRQEAFIEYLQTNQEH